MPAQIHLAPPQPPARCQSQGCLHSMHTMGHVLTVRQSRTRVEAGVGTPRRWRRWSLVGGPLARVDGVEGGRGLQVSGGRVSEVGGALVGGWCGGLYTVCDRSKEGLAEVQEAEETGQDEKAKHEDYPGLGGSMLEILTHRRATEHWGLLAERGSEQGGVF